MTVMIAMLATALCLAGALGFYLCVPHQKLLSAPINGRMGVLGGSGLLLVSLILFLQVSGPAASVFILLTLLMFFWSVLPLPVALLNTRKEKRHGR